ncbi:MAG: RiPP maturation radical SAM C-methyltransferase [Acidobacteriota bacterium]
MYNISLVNMPFANLNLPSIALTQLRSVVEERFGDRVRVRVLYLNHDLAGFMGLDLYKRMSGELYSSGLGDWLFRAIAFPGEPDNTHAYFSRYFPQQTPDVAAMKGKVFAKRAGLERFLGRLVKKYKLADEDLVGFTSMFTQNIACFAMARLIKTRNPGAVTVLGGANCEAAMGREIAKHTDMIDYVFSGPSLVSFPSLVAHQLDGAEEEPRIRGVFTRENSDAEHLRGSGVIGEELPIEVPVRLDYDSFLADVERHFPDGKVEPYIPFETSRGCWWGERSHCTFCGLNGGAMAYRSMPSEQAVELFQDLFDRYGGRTTRFESVDNILPREYLKEVLPRLDPPDDAALFYEVKADLKAHEMEILARAKVTAIQPGIESLATSTLKLMGKGTTSFQNLAFLKNCLRFGIQPVWNLLIGFPGEREDVYKKYLEDLPLLVHLQPPSGAYPVRFDRFSPYFTRAEQYGLDLSPYDFYRIIYPFPEESFQHIAYFFEDRNYNSKYLQEMVAWQDQLNTAVRRWQGRYSAEDGRQRAALRFLPRGEGAAVQDTRSGESVEHELEPLELQVLRFVDLKGWNVKSIARHLHEEASSVEAALARLRERQLLFEENGRHMSLVLGLVELDEELTVPQGMLAEPSIEQPSLGA